MNKELLKNEDVVDICKKLIQDNILYIDKEEVNIVWNKFVKENTKEEVPILITEDGVKYYTIDNQIYRVRKDFLFEPTKIGIGTHGLDHQIFLFFSTLEAAESWLVMNKPLFSVNELKKMEQYGNSGILLTIDKQSLFSKAKEKLKQ